MCMRNFSYQVPCSRLPREQPGEPGGTTEILQEEMSEERVDQYLNDYRDYYGPNQARPEDARVHHVELEAEHRPEHEEGQLGGRRHGLEAGGDEGVGFTANAQQHGQTHH